MARKDSYKRYFLAAALVAVAVVLYWKYSMTVRSAARDSISSVQSFLYSTSHSLNSFFRGDPEIDELKDQNDIFKVQLSDLIYANAELSHLKVENEELRLMLGYFDNTRENKVIAKIIGSDPALDNALIIDRGYEDGIREGQAVMAGKGNIVGKIIKAASFHSTVILVTDSQLRLSVSLIGANKPIGIASGELGLSIIIDLVPQNTELNEGDILITSSLDRSVPPGLVVGRVNRIISSENDLFKKASLSPLVDFQDLSTVAVITTQDD